MSAAFLFAPRLAYGPVSSRQPGTNHMPAELVTWWFLFRIFIKRNNGWIGEVVTALVTLAYTLTSLATIDQMPLMRSVGILAVGMDPNFIYGIQLGGAVLSLGGLALMPIHPYEMRFARLIGSVILFIWWAAMAWALAIATPWHPLIYIYLSFPVYSAWAALSVLHERLD